MREHCSGVIVMYSSPQQSLNAAFSQIKKWPDGVHVPAHHTDDQWGNMRMDILISELRKKTIELRQEGENFHQQMCHMYNVFKEVAKAHGKRRSALNERFTDVIACDSEDGYDIMDWKALENRCKTPQNNGTASVDSGYKSDYPSNNDIVSCPSYPKKPKILMGTRLIGWQKSRDCISGRHRQMCSFVQQKKEDIRTSLSSINEEKRGETRSTEEDCVLSPPLRIVRFSDNVKTSKCKRIVPKYKKNRLSFKGTPSPSETCTLDCFENTGSHSYGKIVYYDLDGVDFLSTTSNKPDDTRGAAIDIKGRAPKEVCYHSQAAGEDLADSIQRRRSNFKKPSSIKTIPNSHYRRKCKVDSKSINSAVSRRNPQARHLNYYCDQQTVADDSSDSSHIYEEIIYDVAPKGEGSTQQVPPLPMRPRELWKSAISECREENTKHYRRKSNLLRSVSNKMEKLTISNTQIK